MMAIFCTLLGAMLLMVPVLLSALFLPGASAVTTAVNSTISCSNLSDAGSGCTGTTSSGGTVTKQTCTFVIGADNGAALVDADLGPQGQQCKVDTASTLLEIDVNADAGTPSVIVRKKHCGTFTAGVCTSWTSTDVLSSALAAAASNFDACSKTTAVTGLDGGTTCSATLQNTSIAAGDWLELKSGTAGGTAKRVSVAVIRSIP